MNNIGFIKQDQESLRGSLSNLSKKKIKIALEYQELLYKILLLSLRVGYIEGREDPRQAV